MTGKMPPKYTADIASNKEAFHKDFTDISIIGIRVEAEKIACSNRRLEMYSITELNCEPKNIQ